MENSPRQGEGRMADWNARIGCVSSALGSPSQDSTGKGVKLEFIHGVTQIPCMIGGWACKGDDGVLEDYHHQYSMVTASNSSHFVSDHFDLLFLRQFPLLLSKSRRKEKKRRGIKQNVIYTHSLNGYLSSQPHSFPLLQGCIYLLKQ